MNRTKIIGIPILLGVIALIVWAIWPDETEAGKQEKKEKKKN